MNYQKYQKSLKGAGKAIGAAALILLLAACGDGGAGESSNVVDADELLAANQYEEGKSGVWGDITYGSADAPVTVIEYASLTCPHCANFANTIFPSVKKKFIDSGKIRFIYRNYVMNGADMTASIVARCRDMDVAKRLTKVFFSRQSEWARAEDRNGALASLARRTANMSRSEFDRCASDRKMMASLTEMTKTASGFRVVATPTIFVDGVSVDDFRWENLDKVLEKATAK
jgi:protein-disulfide isomerase